jgi:hypothetical protein
MGLLDALMKEVGTAVGGADPAHQALASELGNATPNGQMPGGRWGLAE